MPYVEKQVKEWLDKGMAPTTTGELTYVLTARMLAFDKGDVGREFTETAMHEDIDQYLSLHPTVRYDILCGVVGSLECARREFMRRRPDSWITPCCCIDIVAQEFYRDTVAPYEDTKIEQNGDVF